MEPKILDPCVEQGLVPPLLEILPVKDPPDPLLLLRGRSPGHELRPDPDRMALAAVVKKLIEVATLRASCSAKHAGTVNAYDDVRAEALAVSPKDPK